MMEARNAPIDGPSTSGTAYAESGQHSMAGTALEQATKAAAQLDIAHLSSAELEPVILSKPGQSTK